MDFPIEIKNIIGNLKYKEDTTGRSGDKVYIFEDKYVLKISNNKERLLREKERIDFLDKCNIPSIKSILFFEENNKSYSLMTYLKGYNLVDKRFINNPELLIDVLVNVIKVLRSIDNYNCPFKSTDNEGNDFVHGDLCLPNIFVDDNNNFIGFIDLDNSGLGDKWYDYSWLLWSLSYNLKTDKYNKLLLDKLDIEFNEEKYNKYIPEDYR